MGARADRAFKNSVDRTAMFALDPHDHALLADLDGVDYPRQQRPSTVLL
ncbi:hypothetical protein [Auritidibacter ignavus]|nr:hypothetical protein [Auritidibacter ignavus]